MSLKKRPIRKAIFPVAGLGTRFLPATKALPKEMLPLVDKPLIQYALEEAQASGIEEFIFVTGRGKTAIEDHFDASTEFENLLKSRGKTEALQQMRSISLDPGCLIYTRQQDPLGLGHALWCARHLIQDEPFAVLLADDFVRSPVPCLSQMIQEYEHGNMVAVMEVPPHRVSSYGILDIQERSGSKCHAKGVVEKPPVDLAPSQTAIIGRYILDPSIFAILENQGTGSGGEIQLTDALATSLKQNTPLTGYYFQGKRYDCGSKGGFMAASLAVAMENPDMREELITEWDALLANEQTTLKERAS